MKLTFNFKSYYPGSSSFYWITVPNPVYPPHDFTDSILYYINPMISVPYINEDEDSIYETYKLDSIVWI